MSPPRESPYEPGAALACPACGAVFDLARFGKCPLCATVTTLGELASEVERLTGLLRLKAELDAERARE
jgi:hypothetical protein